MAGALLQFDFPAAGPWGEAMAGALNEATGEQGGIYLFADAERLS